MAESSKPESDPDAYNDLQATTDGGDPTQAQPQFQSPQNTGSQNTGSQHTGSQNTGAQPARFGSYKVVRELGSGAFGSVYEARHAETGAVVAVKALKDSWARDPDCGPQMRAQFAAEAQMMLQFDHPCVVRVISMDDRADPPYFVQEFIDGETLAQRLLRGKPTLEETLEYAIQIADGLAHIHSRERWHRDLKPANILLDRDNQVHLADFGLALDDAQRWQSARAAAGTFPYMAPEQIRGSTHLLNARCDLWAFGVILYEMLSGKRPFQGETRSQLCGEILERTPTSPREIIPEVPRKLNRICMQCLSKRDSDRPDAAADVREDLREVLARLRGGEDSTEPGSTASVKPRSVSQANVVQYPIPTLRRFTAEQTELYLRLMPKSYNNPDELPELIGYWKHRITNPNRDEAFRIGVMVGVSGCGKSSLLEAGLVPNLPANVVPILIEASDTETETRILSKLRHAFPEADPAGAWSLADWTFRFREGQILAAGQKVVMILDQFEQWLNAHGGESSSPLLDALHQCDGRHLQAIVCVREGFHATLMRFVQSAQIRLDEETNYATAHRFTLDHARFVLEQFGRGLKRVDDSITSNQQAFIDAAIEGLAESDRGVVCVRLVVLASVMQDRLWTVDELEKLGGLDGIGCQFLIDCFEGRTASEQYRRYLPAAMRVLADLLPAEGLEIKDVRSYDQLLAASELDKLQFDDLLTILTRKLFLLTLVEADTGPSSLATSNSQLATNFQLTHDFLVPSLREWLSRKLRETKAGRARLRLQDRTAAWTSKPENRNLPSLWEWITIRRLTDRQKWKPNEQAVMRRAGRVHATRGGFLASAIAILAIVGFVIRGEVAEQQQRTRVEGLLAQLTSAEPAQLPEIVRQLDKVPQLAEEFLAPLIQAEPKTLDERRSLLHARLALVGRDASVVDPLVEEMIGNKVAYITPIRELLQPYAQSITERLQAMLKDAEAKNERRFRAGVALAGLADASYTWREADLQFMASELVAANAEYQPVLRENLHPIAAQLLGPIEGVFKDAEASDAMRLSAANAVADFAADQAELLTRLLADATPAQYEVLYPLAEQARSEQGIEELERIASTLPPDALGSVARVAYGQRRANAAVSLLRFGERETVLPVFDYTDDPEALTQFIFRCRPREVGIEPLLELLEIATRRVSEGNQSNARARYALLLTLGQFALDEVPESRREALIAQLSDWYANDPSSGVHGACGWLLRHWGQDEIATKVDQTPVPYTEDREWFTLAITVNPTAPPHPNAIEEADASDGASSETDAGGDNAEETTEGDSDNAAEPSDEIDAAPIPAETLPAKTFYYTFIVFPAGESWIGSVEDEPDRSPQESRELRHVVKLTRPFAILDREVTFEELIAFDPQYVGAMTQFKAAPEDAGFGADWYDSVRFCRWLGVDSGLPESDQAYASPTSLSAEAYPRDPNPAANGAPRDWPINVSRRGFRLPTESEWEIAARAGSRTSYGFGSELGLLDQFGWFQENSKAVRPPKGLLPSGRGLFDLHGNLFEWTHDWYDGFDAAAGTDPLGAPSGSYRVIRGGSWYDAAAFCRSASCRTDVPTNRAGGYGFRLALSPSGASQSAEPVEDEQVEPSGVGTEGVAEQRP